MIKNQLAQSEPVAFKSIQNCLRENKVAHSYLFSGEYNPLKIETAYLLAMSIIEGKNDFACEICDTCKRIRKNEYYDVIYVDGYSKSIKKEEIENILEEFSRTSLEQSGKKVYIIANINNSSNKVLNMILKFMEEPGNDNTFGIFITDNKEDLLSTIVSRCHDIPFKTRDFSFLINQYEDAGFDYIDAYLLSHILHKFDSEFDLNDERYLCAKEYVYKTIESLHNKKEIPLLFFKEFYPYFKDRDDFKKTTDYYLSIMIKMIEDSLENIKTDDNDYNVHLDTLSKYNPVKLLEIFSEESDKLLFNADRKLLFDSIAHKIILYI